MSISRPFIHSFHSFVRSTRARHRIGAMAAADLRRSRRLVEGGLVGRRGALRRSPGRRHATRPVERYDRRRRMSEPPFASARPQNKSRTCRAISRSSARISMSMSCAASAGQPRRRSADGDPANPPAPGGDARFPGPALRPAGQRLPLCVPRLPLRLRCRWPARRCCFAWRLCRS